MQLKFEIDLLLYPAAHVPLVDALLDRITNPTVVVRGPVVREGEGKGTWMATEACWTGEKTQKRYCIQH